MGEIGFQKRECTQHILFFLVTYWPAVDGKQQVADYLLSWALN